MWTIDTLNNVSLMKSDAVTLLILDKIPPTGGISIFTLDSDYRYRSYSRYSEKFFYKYRGADNDGLVGTCLKFFDTTIGEDFNELDIPNQNSNCWNTYEKVGAINFPSLSKDIQMGVGERKLYLWLKDDSGNISATIRSILKTDLYGGYTIKDNYPY